MTNTEWLRYRLLAAAGVDDRPIGDKTQSLDDIMRSQWSDEFEALRRAAMVIGYFRYGNIHNKGVYNNIKSAIQRLRLFQRWGNGEYLVDAANLCEIEFVQQNHPNYHFKSSDDGIHTEKYDKHL